MNALLVLLGALQLPSQAPAPAAPATKIQRSELAAAQRARDSIVSARWESRRLAQNERDAWQDEFEHLRDSLETIRSERGTIDAEALRIARDAQASAAPAIVSDPSDPLDPYRRPLQERARVLRERVAQSLPWDRDRRLARLDSLVERLGEAGAETALADLSAAWASEWAFAHGSEILDTTLPRPEGDVLKGRLVRLGTLGAWYVGEQDGVAGILARSPTEGWMWREDLTDSVRLGLASGLSRPGGLLPLDPGGAAPDGEGFFAVEASAKQGFVARLGTFFSFQDGPLHVAARWAARLVMVLLLGLGGAVAWIGVRRHRILARHEVDDGRYEPHLLQAMAGGKPADDLLARCADTFAGHVVKGGLAARHLSPEALEQVLTAQESAEGRHLESGLGLLGTIGSNAPFIGLFGTVCGILDAFAALGQVGGGPQAVMTAIAEALVATAIGLLVAIPAIWIYNSLQLRVQEILARGRELRTLMVAASLEAAARGRQG